MKIKLKIKGEIVEIEEEDSKVKYCCINLTPELAKIFINSQENNRRVYLHDIKRLEYSIENNEYVLNPQPICLDKNNRLIDGQHRCMAVIQTKKNIPVILAINVDRGTLLYMDIGRKRSLVDTFTLNKIKYPTKVSSISRLDLTWDMINNKSRNLSYLNVLSHYKVINENNNIQYLTTRILTMQSKYKTKYIIPISLITLMYRLQKIDKHISELFLTDVFKDVSHPSIQSAKNFTEKIKNKILLARFPSRNCLHVFALAWNDFIKNKSIQAYDINTMSWNILPKLESPQ